jgi:hypothetical protein
MSRLRIGIARTTVLGLALMSSIAGCSAAATNGGGAASAGARRLQHLSSLERRFLADRYVTTGEYDLAIQATVGCLRANGFHVSNPEPDMRGLLSYSISYAFGGNNPTQPPSQQQQDRAAALEDKCQNETAAVQAVYILDHPVSAQKVQQAFQSMIHCLGQSGLLLSGQKKLSDLKSVILAAVGAVRAGQLTDNSARHCEAEYQAVSIRPLPGLRQALAALQNP